MPPVVAAMSAALLRTVEASPATPALQLSAVCGRVLVPQRVRSLAPLRIPHSPLAASTAATAVMVAVCDSGLMAAEATATTTATDAWVLMGGDTRVSTILIGGRILVRRSIMTSNTRPAWPTR